MLIKILLNSWHKRRNYNSIKPCTFFNANWNYNTFKLTQRGKLIESIGDKFSSGGASGPYYVTVKGNLELTMTYFGYYNSQQMGITIKYANGTIIYKRGPGKSLGVDEVVLSFCPLRGCTGMQYQTMAITMTDSGGNGWESNALAVNQNGTMEKTFGSSFTSGSTSGPIYVVIQTNIETSISVYLLGANTQEIGFVAKKVGGELIHERKPGAPFTMGTIFTKFCPGVRCGKSRMITLKVTMADSGADGWNGNVLAFKQDGLIVDYFGHSFMSGASNEPIYITLKGVVSTKTQIVVHQLGTKPEEISFTITTPNDTTIYQRVSGTPFTGSTIFKQFCPIRCAQFVTYTAVTTGAFPGFGWQDQTLGFLQNGIFVSNYGYEEGVAIPIVLEKNVETALVPFFWISMISSYVSTQLKNQDGATIFSRSIGIYSPPAPILTHFCTGTCGTSDYVDMVILMYDQGNDGWNGNSFCLVQLGRVVGIFGQDFGVGASQTVTIPIHTTHQLTISTHFQGSKPTQLSFQLKLPNNTLLFQHRSGNQIPAGAIMTAFCVSGNCADSTYEQLVIEMSDGGGDGWNNNILSLTQNNTILTTFGSTFTTGSTHPQKIYTLVKIDSTFELTVQQYGTKTEEIGFTVRKISGELLYQRVGGSGFWEGTVFGSFCVGGACGRRSYVRLGVDLGDLGADGWNGNVLALKQNNRIVGTFGDTFTSGSQKKGSIFITIYGNSPNPTQIIVHQLGTKTQQITFKITSPNGTIIYQRTSGTTFDSTTIFTQFCPIKCPTLITLTIGLSSPYNFGWNGNILSLTQNKKMYQLGEKFITGSSYPPISLSFEDDAEIRLEFFKFGVYSGYIGLSITAPNGTTIYSQNSQTPVSENTIFTTFCLNECPAFTTVTVMMTDTNGGGWNGNVLGVKQNQDVVGVFGRRFGTGDTPDPVVIELQGNLLARVFVVSYGTNTDHIGFVIRAQNGTVIYQKTKGASFPSDHVFADFCPISGCPAVATNQLVLTIAMTGTNGWNSNILAIKQEGTVVDTFGSTFTSGTSSGPVTISVLQDKEVQVVVSSLGTNTEQIGFTITAPNGTIIYQRSAGSPFYAGSIFSVFCPVDLCPPSNYLKLEATMSDSGSDGWNGNVLAVKQNGAVIGTFGNTFTNGKTGNPVEIIAQGNKGAQIIVQTLGTKTNQIGFVIKGQYGRVIHQRASGAAFLANHIFATFCPMSDCEDLTILSFMMTDTGGDGWNYNIIGVKQNGMMMGTVGNNFKSGSSNGPVYIAVMPNERVQIAVSQLGLKTNEIGFVVRDQTGRTIYTRTSGTIFTYTTIFSFFCPDICSNTIALSISMSDSGSDGWNGNTLAIMQNGAVVGTFGSAFTSGGSSDPVSFTVQGDKEVQVVVFTLGTKTEEVGFTVTASNGTVLYQRASGAPFFSGTVLSLLCPIEGCSPTNYFKMTVTMTDTGNDGWNNNILAVKQNGAVVDTFGAAFKSGNSSGPVTIILQGNLGVQITVYQLGTKTEEMTFIARAPNNTIISQKYSGVTFAANNVFATFCPTSSCADLLLLQVTMTDTLGDGWNYNIIGIKQNGALVGTFGSAFKTGSSSGPLYIPILPNERTQIAVSQLGLKTNEIGFVVKDPSGNIVCSRTSGKTFTSTTVFAYFCPVSCANTLTLNIVMTDSGNDGWNGNVLAIKQDGSIVGTFGNTFSSGGSSGPTSITVQGDKQVQITVSTLGTKTEEVGFTVTASNGTVIHQRSSGVTFPVGDIFFNFCPFGGCPPTNFLTLAITMTDSVGDGWNGIVLAVKQNNVIVGTFGDTFTSGSASGPVFITVQGNLETRVVFSQYSSKVSEIGFIISASNGTRIFRKYTGTTYLSNKIFSTFCPIDNCPSSPRVVYYVIRTDSGSNGWEGTELTFTENGVFMLTLSMSEGAQYDPATVDFLKYATVRITVTTMGSNSHQIGLKIVNSQGETVFQRNPGVRLYSSTPVGSFCVECVNLSPVSTAVGSSELRAVELNGGYYEATDAQLNEAPSESNQGFIIAIYVLASALIILVAISAFSFLKKAKNIKQKSSKSDQSEKPQKNIQAEEAEQAEENLQSAQNILKNQQAINADQAA